MTEYYFIRHGEPDYSEAETKIYRGWGYNMMTLSEKGISQIEHAANDPQLCGAELILTSPYGRALHTAAIISRALDLPISVETDLHEWMADADYNWLDSNTAYARLADMNAAKGTSSVEGDPWETAESMKKRVFRVLDKYHGKRKVIVACHGTLMQYVLGVDHPAHGEIVRFVR